MNFKVKDLMITILPEKAELEELCLLRTLICRGPVDVVDERRQLAGGGMFGIDVWYTDPCFKCSELITHPRCLLRCSNIPSLRACRATPLERFTPELFGQIVINDVADIPVLRAELNEVLTKLDELEATGLEELPRTAEGLAELEVKLQEAVKAVQAKKAGAKKAK